MPPVPLLQLHGKLHAFGLEVVVEGVQGAVIQEAKVVRTPGIMAGELGKRLTAAGLPGSKKL